MKRSRIHHRLFLIGFCCSVFVLSAQADRRPFHLLSSPQLTEVRIEDGFWSPRLETFRKVTLLHCFEKCRETGRLANFDRAAGRETGPYQGAHFNDSDVYKIVEGAALSLASHPDPELEKLVATTIERIAAAQQPDGYLDTYFTIDRRDERFRHIHPVARHELYCMGHAIEAGATHFQLTGSPAFVAVAEKLADHIASVFGPGKRYDVPEHQELEPALIKLYRVTGKEKYLKLAEFFINERGDDTHHTLYGSYSQDHVPFREQREIVGHAVRAMYNCVGAADLYAETGDPALLKALKRLWKSTTERKMYITGGIGAEQKGEAFSYDYHLPNRTAYSETCAQIGLLFFAHHMLCIDPHARYADVLERVLYNGFLSGISLSGDKFFYQNRLAGDGSYRRVPWYGCACCPSNIVRVFPSIGQYICQAGDNAVYVQLYISSSTKLKLQDRHVTVTQKTRYPRDGSVAISLASDSATPVDLFLRIPEWIRSSETPGGLYTWNRPPGTTARLDGVPIDCSTLENGYLHLRTSAHTPRTYTLAFSMPILRVHAHPQVGADRGRVALQRGPLIYCVEDVDISEGADSTIDTLCLPPNQPLETEFCEELLGGVQVIHPAADGKKGAPSPWHAIPYYARDNRGKSAMTVYLVEDRERAGPIKTASWVGTNYTPAFCVNQVQMWHEFKPEIIDRELKAAKKHFGLTTLRVYLHNIPYDAEKELFLSRIDRFLELCNRHDIRPGFVFFDDCHRHEGITLKSLPPVKGWHNGRWAACPQDRERTAGNMPKFKAYVQDVIAAHRTDKRILWWEIFNEPNMRSAFSVALRKSGYRWAKELKPAQPVLCCWNDSAETDIVDAHNYSADFASWNRQTELNPEKGTVFTEAGARWYPGKEKSNGEPCEVISWLTERKKAKLYTPGVYLCWELFAGNSNCRWYWGTEKGAAEPTVPWCGLMWPDCTPVSLAEAEAIRSYTTGASRALFFDDFQTLVLPKRSGWTAYAPSLPAESGVMKLTSTMKLVTGKPSWTDYVLETMVMLREKTGNAGVIVRVTDPGPGTDQMHGYYIGFNTETLYLGRQRNRWESLAEFDLKRLECNVTPGAWNLLRVMVEGPRIKVWFNRLHTDDGVRIDFTDTQAPLLSGAVGYRTHQTEAWFDNIVVLPVP